MSRTPLAFLSSEDLFDRLHGLAPDVFAQGDVSLHSYRHALGTYVDSHYGRSVTRAALGHTTRRTSTDHYIHIDDVQKAEAITADENHVQSTEHGTSV